nr:hypothetical protein [uncultured Enterobacter sp.]
MAMTLTSQKSTVFKRLHLALTVTLLLLVAGFAVCQLCLNGKPDDKLDSHRQITENTFLYVTKYNGGGATVSDVFRYYLDGDIKGDLLKHLADRSPFLVADTNTAKVTGYGSHVNVSITGRVYSFTNSDLFYSDGIAVMPVISITANGVR